MPYIGNTAGNRFVASQAATRLSGDGSETVFTLEHSVASDEDILVSVDGVIQEPSIAYAVSNGTTLTFTAAPSNGTNNIFVCYLFRTVATVDHPSTSALTATDGTFSSTLNVTGATTLTADLTVDTDTLKVDTTNDKVGINTANPNDYYSDELVVTAADEGGMTFVTGTTHANYINFADGTSGNAAYRGFLKYDHNNDNMTLGTSAASAITIDANGVVIKGSNPSFRAMGNVGSYQTTSPVPFPSISGTNVGGHNTGSHYNTSNYRFTAPVAGRYLMHVHMGIVRITANNGNGYPYLRINSTSVAYSYVHVPTGTAYHPANITQIVELAANDYVDVIFGGSNSDYYGNYTELSFSGCLIG